MIYHEEMEKPEVIFVVDPMCSWCWGFAPVIEKIRSSYEEQYNFSLTVGGLRKAGEMAWDEKTKRYLRGHWEEVSRKSGQPFDLSLFDKTIFEYDTTPACKAVVTVRELLGTEQAFRYLHAIQSAFYTQGIDITNPRLLQGYYEQLFGNSAKFAFFFLSERAETLTEHDFAKARAMGATAFPSVVLIDKEGHMMCQKGYRSENEMKQLLEKRDA